MRRLGHLDWFSIVEDPVDKNFLFIKFKTSVNLLKAWKLKISPFFVFRFNRLAIEIHVNEIIWIKRERDNYYFKVISVK